MYAERVGSLRALEEFKNLSDARMVPIAERLDESREPFWQHAKRQLFLLRDGTRAVGRVVAIADEAHDRRYGERIGFFSWLECPDNLAGARALLEAAAQWLREHEYTAMRGPLHIGLGETLGALVDGFDRSPTMQLPYNEAHVPGLLSQLGFVSVHESNAYLWVRDEVPAPPTSLRRLGQQKGSGPVYRTLNARDLDGEVHRFLSTYNIAFDNRFGFVPLTENEARARLRDLAPFANLGLVWLAEVDGEPAGVAIGMPSISVPTDRPKARFSRLHALRSVLRAKRMERVHLVALAVDPRHQGRHIGAHLLLRLWRAALDLGVAEVEISGIDPADQSMQQLLWRLGCHRIRRFCTYEQAILR